MRSFQTETRETVGEHDELTVGEALEHPINHRGMRQKADSLVGDADGCR